VADGVDVGDDDAEVVGGVDVDAGLRLEVLGADDRVGPGSAAQAASTRTPAAAAHARSTRRHVRT
jgi:hypothetical protein